MARVEGNLIGILLVVAGGLLAACSHPTGDSAAPLIKRHGGAVAGAGGASDGTPADSGPTDLVAAVAGNGGEGAVALKFQVAQRPVAGKPVVVTLRLVATEPLEQLEARFRPDDGLEVTQGADFDPAGPMEKGTAVDQTLTLLPAHEGVYAVMATVTARSADAAVSRSFVIPIVVASDAPPAAPPTAGPVTAIKSKRK